MVLILTRGKMMIYELILTVLLALALAFVLRLIWLEIKPKPPKNITWDESIFDDLNDEDTWQ